jgi:hypothetical protein
VHGSGDVGASATSARGGRRSSRLLGYLADQFTEDQSQALLVLTAPPRTEGYEKLQLLAVLGQEHFAEAQR